MVAAPRAGARLAEPRAERAANRKSSSSAARAAERSLGSGAFDPAASAAARSLGDERTGDLPETAATTVTGERPAMGAEEGAAGASSKASSAALLFVFAALFRRGDARPFLGVGVGAGGATVVLSFSSPSPRFPSSPDSFASGAVGVAQVRREADEVSAPRVPDLRALASSPIFVEDVFFLSSSTTSAAATRATALEARSFWRSATGVVRFLVAVLSNQASTVSSSFEASGAWKSK